LDPAAIVLAMVVAPVCDATMEPAAVSTLVRMSCTAVSACATAFGVLASRAARVMALTCLLASSMYSRTSARAAGGRVQSRIPMLIPRLRSHQLMTRWASLRKTTAARWSTSSTIRWTIPPLEVPTCAFLSRPCTSRPLAT
jgi:hypothetical protein